MMTKAILRFALAASPRPVSIGACGLDTPFTA